MKYVPVIPCLNPPYQLVGLIEDLIELNIDKIIIIDDGSINKNLFDKLGKKKECIVLTHEANMGKGTSIKDAIEYYLDNLVDDFDGIVTIDCDGQHTAKDMNNVAERMLKTNNPTIGVRTFKGKNVPLHRKLGNKITCKLFKKLFKVYISDTQSGLRAFPNECLEMLLNTKGERFEYEINVLIDLVTNKKNIEEVEIKTIYMPKKEKRSYFSPIKDSFKIYREMFKKYKSLK